MGSSSSSDSGPNAAGRWQGDRNQICGHSYARYKVVRIKLYKCPVGFLAFTHWFVEVWTRCDDCGQEYVYTFDFGKDGCECRRGEYTRGCRVVDGFTPQNMSLEQVKRVYSGCEWSGRSFNVATNNCKDWANEFYMRLGGDDCSGKF
eukprot:CAMPEP_0170274644 /NCGR_PEP_ID=MMETSP0116_2-20130129/37297_1 /TAXON_ID=400756 /ORGANISM="Durinskia baltica, Strain CSIRO CS-38" /LENGTH=146 /DNA_ID=CAMNT_0010525897 /DNA_START=82 /DNA_END=522 /DNA_ORIENTATION=+